MVFALCPDIGPPRLWRFVETLPVEVLTELDAAQNLLLINREAFEKLSELDKHRVLRTQRQYIWTDEFYTYN